MLLNHIGVANRSREDALKFYRDFLGLPLTREVTVPGELSEQLFSIPRGIPMLVFEKDGTKIEVFICAECGQPASDIKHFGLSLKNFQEVIEGARQAGIELIIGRTKEKTVYFLKDLSGNLIEIKQL